MGGSCGLQGEKRSSSLGGEKQLHSGQSEIVEPAGFADGLGVEWREGKANGDPRVSARAVECCLVRWRGGGDLNRRWKVRRSLQDTDK